MNRASLKLKILGILSTGQKAGLEIAKALGESLPPCVFLSEMERNGLIGSYYDESSANDPDRDGFRRKYYYLKRDGENRLQEMKVRGD